MSMELKKKFDELYNYIVASRDTGKMRMLGWVMKDMMKQTIDNHPKMAEEYINVLESVKWDNYLTEKEADTIVKAMQPAPAWLRPTWGELMKKLSKQSSWIPYFNECALFVTMCMIDSDSGPTIKDLMTRNGGTLEVMDYFDAVYRLAINKLMDEDGVFNIRRYFKEVLWPEEEKR